MFNKLAIPVAVAALIVIGILRSSPKETETVRLFHEEIMEIVDRIPLDTGDWRSEEVILPSSATSLLRPNALLARRYVDTKRGVSATLMFVQCEDARDMAGHFPPRCYPANGWLEPDEPNDGVIQNSAEQFAMYEYTRVAGKNEREITVYNLFALPTGQRSIEMQDVYQLRANVQYRYFGAAQVQVVIDGMVDAEDHEWVLSEMYAIVKPAVDFVRQADAFSVEFEGGAS